MDQDQEHLRLISILHYVLAGMAALGGCFPIFHLAIGIAAVSGAIPPPPEDDARLFQLVFGWMFIGVAVVMMVFGWAIAIAILIAARKFASHSSYMYCLVIAALECMFFPLGTALGVFSITVLMRPSVKTLFGTESVPAVR